MTLRELLAMAEGAWSKTASILSMLHNVNRDPKKGRAAVADDFNPYRSRRPAPPVKPAIVAANFDILKTVFIDRKG